MSTDPFNSHPVNPYAPSQIANAFGSDADFPGTPKKHSRAGILSLLFGLAAFGVLAALVVAIIVAANSLVPDPAGQEPEPPEEVLIALGLTVLLHVGLSFTAVVSGIAAVAQRSRKKSLGLVGLLLGVLNLSVVIFGMLA